MSERGDLERLARVGARSVYLGDKRIVATVLARFKMFLATDDVGIVPHLALDGYWESWVTCAMMRMVRPGMRVINVGANFGYYALLFADLVGKSGSVVAVEPNPELCVLIDKSKHANGFSQLTVVRAAAADESGVGTVVIPDGYCMNAHLGDVSGTDGVVVATQIATVDRIAGTAWGYVELGHHEVPRAGVENVRPVLPDVVFIDAEGAEERIWEGMGITRAKKDVTLVIEYSPGRYKDALGFAKKFKEDGFALGFINNEGAIEAQTPEQLAAGPEVMVVLRRPR